MRFSTKLIYLIIFTFILNACTSEDDSPIDVNEQETTDDTTIPSDLEALVIENVSYGSNDQQVYDIYLPAGRTSEETKVLVLVHGGGWVEGDKSDMTDFVLLVQQSLPDYAVVNINYVLANTTTTAFPNQFLDLEAVLDQLTSQSEDLQIRPDFGLIGASAGAHISLIYDYVYDTTDRVKMVCSIVGPTDFTDPFYTSDPNFDIYLSLLIDESQYPDGTNYAEATSPVYQVTSSSSPTILFYGNTDPLVPLTNAISLDQALTDASITHSFTTYNGGHGNWEDADLLDLKIKLIDYITTYLPVVLD